VISGQVLATLLEPGCVVVLRFECVERCRVAQGEADIVKASIKQNLRKGSTSTLRESRARRDGLGFE